MFQSQRVGAWVRLKSMHSYPDLAGPIRFVLELFQFALKFVVSGELGFVFDIMVAHFDIHLSR